MAGKYLRERAIMKRFFRKKPAASGLEPGKFGGQVPGPRRRQKKKHEESGLGTAIETRLQLYQNQGALVFARNNVVKANILRPDGTTYWMRCGIPGTSDYYIWMDGGRFIFLEAKIFGKLADNQRVWCDHVKTLGYEYHIIRDVAELGPILFPKRSDDTQTIN